MLESQAATNRLSQGDLAQAQAADPTWFAHYDEIQADRADFEELYALMESAPTEFTRGLVYGRIMARMDVAAVTGEAF
jgi:hypothetical protein